MRKLPDLAWEVKKCFQEEGIVRPGGGEGVRQMIGQWQKSSGDRSGSPTCTPTAQRDLREKSMMGQYE